MVESSHKHNYADCKNGGYDDHERSWFAVVTQNETTPLRHFGDFDLAGIHIFLTELYQHLGDRSSFLIPSDIDNRLKFGSQKRYNSQVSSFSGLKSDNKKIQFVIDLINKYHRCYDQEGYISME